MKNKDLGIDQSLSKCAFSYSVNGIPERFKLSKTGASTVKNKKPDTTYYEDVHQQIHHICRDLVEYVEEFKPDRITFEALSFASIGNVTRSLASLYGAMRETLIVNFPNIPVYEVAPTSLKSFGRGLLPDNKQFKGVLKTGKPKKVKMDKKLMVEAAKETFGDRLFKGYNYSTGLDDIADASLLAHKAWKDYNGS